MPDVDSTSNILFYNSLTPTTPVTIKTPTLFTHDDGHNPSSPELNSETGPIQTTVFLLALMLSFSL